MSKPIEKSDADWRADLTDEQYDVLEQTLKALLKTYPNLKADAITGHEHIAAGRKTDPGPHFEWDKLSLALGADLPTKCKILTT